MSPRFRLLSALAIVVGMVGCGPSPAPGGAIDMAGAEGRPDFAGHCHNGVQDFFVGQDHHPQTESDVDCGGECPPCKLGQRCNRFHDPPTSPELGYTGDPDHDCEGGGVTTSCDPMFWFFDDGNYDYPKDPDQRCVIGGTDLEGICVQRRHSPAECPGQCFNRLTFTCVYWGCRDQYSDLVIYACGREGQACFDCGTNQWCVKDPLAPGDYCGFYCDDKRNPPCNDGCCTPNPGRLCVHGDTDTYCGPKGGACVACPAGTHCIDRKCQ
jgi:hypothetical protein